MSAHTPTPWSLSDSQLPKAIYGSARQHIHAGPKETQGNTIAIVSLGGLGGTSGKIEDIEANAAYIVRAVNSHEELVAALKEIHHSIPSATHLHEIVTSAIAKAEGRA